MCLSLTSFDVLWHHMASSIATHTAFGYEWTKHRPLKAHVEGENTIVQGFHKTYNPKTPLKGNAFHEDDRNIHASPILIHLWFESQTQGLELDNILVCVHRDFQVSIQYSEKQVLDYSRNLGKQHGLEPAFSLPNTDRKKIHQKKKKKYYLIFVIHKADAYICAIIRRRRIAGHSHGRRRRRRRRRQRQESVVCPTSQMCFNNLLILPPPPPPPRPRNRQPPEPAANCTVYATCFPRCHCIPWSWWKGDAAEARHCGEHSECGRGGTRRREKRSREAHRERRQQQQRHRPHYNSHQRQRETKKAPGAVWTKRSQRHHPQKGGQPVVDGWRYFKGKCLCQRSTISGYCWNFIN